MSDESQFGKKAVIEDYRLENIVHRKINDQLWLSPYDAERFFKVGKFDAQLLSAGTEDEETKKFLPGLSTSEDALKKRVFAVELGLGISYLITIDRMPVGMFELDSPKTNKVQHNMPIWTINYFVVSSLRNKGIMTSCFPAMMKIMAKDIGIEEVYAWVHENNYTSIGILEKYFFRYVDSIPIHDNSLRPLIDPHYLAFKCPLSEIGFYDTYIDCPSYWIQKQRLL